MRKLTKTESILKILGKKSSSSFTLIELITSITVFVLLVISTLGIYATSITKHRQVLESQVVNEDLKYAMEMMTRDIRDSSVMASSTDGNTIYLFHPTKNIDDATCVVGGYTGCLQYKFNNSMWRIEVKGKGDLNFVPLTSSKIIVEEVNFFIDAEVGNSQDQPMTIILIKAKAKNEKGGSSEIILQTATNQRKIGNSYQGAI